MQTSLQQHNAYESPPWAGIPKNCVYVDVIREGAIIENYALQNKDHYFIGSQESFVDIYYNNPAVSRIHAAIQFSTSGKAFLIDLDSTHGTWKGDERIERRSYIPLTAGDRLTFGNKDAKRAFVIRESNEADYPDEVRANASTVSATSSSDNGDNTQSVEAKQKPLIFSSEGKLTQVALRSLENQQVKYTNRMGQSQQDSTSTWMFEGVEESTPLKDHLLRYFNEETGHCNILKLKKSSEYSLLNPSQIEILKKIESIQASQTVLNQNCSIEDGISVDAENKTFSNDIPEKRSSVSDYEKMALTEDVDAVDSELYRLMQHFFESITSEDRYHMLSTSTIQALDDRLFDEDDAFFDRTGNSNDLVAIVDSTEETIKTLRQQLQAVEEDVTAEEAHLQRLRTANEAQSSGDDVLDVFMKQNETNLKASRLVSLQEQKNRIVKALEQIEKNRHLKLDIPQQKRSANRAMLAASQAVAAIARNHETSSCKRQRRPTNTN